MAKRKILVTGANGQLGKEIRDQACDHPDYEFFFQSREDMPLENFEMIRTVFHLVKPDVFINCAAFTAVDKAESEKEYAFQVNGEAVGIIAALCTEAGTRFIHVSTDYVFDGEGNKPYQETDFTTPVNVYGASKLEGEEQAFRYNPDTIIIRTSWVYSSYGKNFVKTILRLISERNAINVVNDQKGCPTYAKDLAHLILDLSGRKTIEGGLYHFSNQGEISWYDFALAIRDMAGSGCTVKPILTTQFPTPAKRPGYSVLDSTRVMEKFGVTLRPWKDSLRECMEKISSQGE